MLPLLCLSLTVGQLHELDGLPSDEECYHSWYAAYQLEQELQRWSRIGGTYADWIQPALYDTSMLRHLWQDLSTAANPRLCLGERIEAARRARQVHDWQFWGPPPVYPWWQFPCAP